MNQRDDKKTKDLKSDIRERLHDSSQLRLFVSALMVLIGYAAIYVPLSDGIEANSRSLRQEERRRDLADDIESLRDEFEKFEGRLPTDSDTNEWVQYVLGGIRNRPLKLNSLDPGELRRVGPFHAVELNIELAGAFEDLHSLLNWLESNERLIRVDSIKTTPSRNNASELDMSLTVLGLMD